MAAVAVEARCHNRTLRTVFLFIITLQLLFLVASRKAFFWSDETLMATFGDSVVLQLSNFKGEEGQHISSTELSASSSFDGNVPHNYPYAYAYVIGGCDPADARYRGFLYNVMVSSRILKDQGSLADVILFIQLHNTSPYNTLPEQDTRPLKALGVKVKYIPKSKHESFYETVLNKFLILNQTQYRRVLLMDGDVMPLGNLDYYFNLSDYEYLHLNERVRLKENVVMTSINEPSNAGFFMLAPKPGLYQQLESIIQAREEHAALHSNELVRGFHLERGWGHVIEPPDFWRARHNRTGRLWDFHFAFSDQGLLYHWTKYVRKNVTFIFNNFIENWGTTPSHPTIRHEDTIFRAFDTYSKPLLYKRKLCTSFACDISHFTGRGKPWMSNGPPNDLSERTKLTSERHVWWWTLRTLNNELSLGLNLTHWQKISRPSLGLYATYGQIEDRVEQAKLKLQGKPSE